MENLLEDSPDIITKSSRTSSIDYSMKIGGYISMGPAGDSMERILWGFNSFKEWGRSLMVQEKLDGWYGVAIKENGVTRWMAGWKQYSILQNMLIEINEFLPDDSIVVGEVGNGTQSEVEWAAEHGYHRFVMFDCVRFGGVDLVSLSAAHRYKVIQEFWIKSKFSKILCPAIDIVQTYFLGDALDVNSKKEFTWNLFSYIVSLGGEGVVIKDAKDVYYPGARCNSQWKVKKYLTKDYVLMDVTKTEAPTYLAKGFTAGSMVCGLYVDGVLKPITNIGNFEFAIRKELSDFPEKYIGQVVELGAFEIFKSGALRHGMFLRFREDRKPEECVL